MKNKTPGSRKKGPRILAILLAALLLLAAAAAGLTWLGKKAAGSLLSKALAEPLGGVTSAVVTIDPGDGNLALEESDGSGQMLASGTLQYYEKIGAPLSSLSTSGGITAYTLNANGGQPWPNLPWSACNGGTDWLIRLNPAVSYDIAALTGGGNVRIDLSGLTVTRLTAETGGGNMEVSLPDKMTGIDVAVKTGAGAVTLTVGSAVTGSNAIHASSGAGEVTVIIPKGVAARVNVERGTVSVDPGLGKVDNAAYETAGYPNAADKVEITAGSGAGKVNVIIK
jgi:hypothetical protein